MKKTLYDLLEVPQEATPETIKAAYQRLSTLLNPDAPDNVGKPDVATRYHLVKDAYATLSNSARRHAYDTCLLAKDTVIQIEEVEPFWSGKRIIIALALLAVSAGFISWREVEAERLKAEEERLKAEQVKYQQETEQARLEREQEQEKTAQARRANAEYERTRREADYRQRQNDYAEQSAKRQAEYQARREQEAEERKRRMEEAEQERRARQQRYDDERRLRQLEYERGSGRVVILPKN